MPKKVRTTPVSRYAWDAVNGRYFNPATGRTISQTTVLKEINKVIRASNKNLLALASQLAEGRLSLGQWQLAMLDQIKILHTASGVAANGGWAQMSRSDWGFLGGRIKSQYKYAARFARQIKEGTQNIDGSFFRRVAMYSDAAHSTFVQMDRRYQMTENGMEEERADLGEADHCDDCLDRAAQGWQPIGTLPAIGDSVCKTNCHCKFRYRKHDENGEWVESN